MTMCSSRIDKVRPIILFRLICKSLTLNNCFCKQLLDRLAVPSALKVVSNYGVGVNHIDLNGLSNSITRLLDVY